MKESPFIITGDFNSTPEGSALSLLENRFRMQSRCNNFENYQTVLDDIVRNQDKIDGIKGKIKNSYHSEFSNYSKDFHGWIDYILYSPENLKLLTKLDMPPAEDLKDDSGLDYIDLPNRIFPSDHLRVESIFEMK